VDYSQEPIGVNARGQEIYPTRIFDITALVQLDEIVRMLAERKVQEPKKLIDSILEL